MSTKQIALYCEETPGLKLGTGNTASINDTPAGDVIVFRDGFATFEEREFPDWGKWIKAPGTPHIRVLDEASGDAMVAEGAVECPECGRLLKSEFGLTGHLRTHAPKTASTSNPAMVATS